MLRHAIAAILIEVNNNEIQFKIIYALYFEQLTVVEVAQHKGKTRQVVSQTKNRALNKLRESWEEKANII